MNARVCKLLAIFVCCQSVSVWAADDSIEWRIDAAKYLDKTYNQTSQVIDLMAAMLSNDSYREKIVAAADASEPHMSDCGEDFIIFRAAKSKDIDFKSTVVTLDSLVSPAKSNIVTSYGSPPGTRGNIKRPAKELLLLTYSPTTAEMFWIVDDILEPGQVASLTATFEKMAPLWDALVRQVDATDTSNVPVKMGSIWGKNTQCYGARGQYTYGTYVNFMYKKQIRVPEISANSYGAAFDKMPLGQLELLEKVGAFLLGPLARSGINRSTNTEILDLIAQVKEKKLEDFSDLGGGAPDQGGAAGEFDDLNLDDLDL